MSDSPAQSSANEDIEFVLGHLREQELRVDRAAWPLFQAHAASRFERAWQSLPKECLALFSRDEKYDRTRVHVRKACFMGFMNSVLDAVTDIDGERPKVSQDPISALESLGTWVSASRELAACRELYRAFELIRIPDSDRIRPRYVGSPRIRAAEPSLENYRRLGQPIFLARAEHKLIAVRVPQIGLIALRAQKHWNSCRTRVHPGVQLEPFIRASLPAADVYPRMAAMLTDVLPNMLGCGQAAVAEVRAVVETLTVGFENSYRRNIIRHDHDVDLAEAKIDAIDRALGLHCQLSFEFGSVTRVIQAAMALGIDWSRIDDDLDGLLRRPRDQRVNNWYSGPAYGMTM